MIGKIQKCYCSRCWQHWGGWRRRPQPLKAKEF